MPHLHLKRIHTNTAKIPKTTLLNVVHGALARPFETVNSQKQRLTALFFVTAFTASTLLPVFAYANSAQAASKQPNPLAVAQQVDDISSGATGKGSTISGPAPSMGQKPQTQTKEVEIESERTENSETFDIGNGQKKVKTYLDRVYYQNNGKLSKIDNTLIEDANAADANTIVGKVVGFVKGKTQKLNTYKLAANDWQARFAPSDDKVGMVRIESGATKLKFYPKNAAKGVVPTITQEDGKEIVTYKNLWKDIDVQYTVKGGALKEDIIVKSKDAAVAYAFDIKGANLKSNAEGGFDIEGTEQKLAPLSVALQDRGPISEVRATQKFEKGVLTISLDGAWLKTQPASAFPIIVDPSWRRSPNVGWNYTSYKSDGYVCSSSVCYMNAGYLYDNGWKGWRTVFWVSMPELPGKQVLGANLVLNKRSGVGTSEGLYTEVSRANCWGYNCIDYGSPRHSAWFGNNGVINITALLQKQASIGDSGPTYVLNGEERTYTTRKGFDADNSWIEYTINSAPQMTTPIAPANQQVVVTDQPSLQVNAVGDADGDQVQYYYRIATNPDAETGTVINSGWLPGTTQFTIPEGRLQDGVTYYWHTYTYDGNWQTNPNWVRSFKYDARLGNDSAASFDDGGPVDVNLATGNVTTSAGTHSMSALGGSMGLNFEYNSPYRSKQGLTAQYWNNVSFSGSPVVTRTETSVTPSWSLGSPAPGVVPNDNFSAKYKGYFIAPKTGSYVFGVSADDNINLYLSNEANPAISTSCCGGYNWNTAARNYVEGQVVPMTVLFSEVGGGASFGVKVRIDGVEQTIPAEWLRTEPKAVSQNNGLMGRYYYSDASRVFPANEFSAFLARRETNMYFNWGTGAPVAYGPVDNFMARYTGYFTAPVAGTYYFGTGSDDGSRIYLNGGTTPYVNDWVDSGWNVVYGGGVSLSAGQSIPITAEFYENGSGAAFGLYVKGAVAEQVIPSNWLSTKINPLPDGWQMSVDADGNLAYDYASIQAQSVILYDAEGDSHEYKWNGSGYTPPVNEYGHLTKNANGTLTLIDGDGTTYNFDSAGRITATTMPTDDRKPASLLYDYAGTPVRLNKIIDGVDNSRTAQLYYSGDQNCGAADSGFDSQAPFNMLCAFKTTDGEATYLYYKNGQLARIKSSGNVITDIGYDALGRITSQRSSLAYDAILAGVRQDNESVTSQVAYDVLGRASAITLPAATENGFRAKHTYNYLNKATQTNEEGETEPKGYSQRVEYDALYRTVKAYGKDGNATVQEWDAVKDLLYTVTDASGLKSSTIYDANDLPVDNYGPAPAAWFGTDRKPLAAYMNQIPHTQTNYDEGMKGAAVAWFDYTTASGGALTGSPRYHKTGFGGDQQATDLFWQDSNTQAAPITKSATASGVGFTATGTVTFPTAGAYTFQINHEDAARLYIDDKLVIDDWAYRSQVIKQSFSTPITLEANKPYRFKYDYGNADNGYMAFSMRVKGPGIDLSTGNPNPFWGSIMKPAYALTTSTKVFDSQTGDTVTKTDYGAQPELAQAKAVTEDVGGQNLTTSFTYEPYQPGSLMRQTSKTLPGGNAYAYLYYGATEARANPCVADSPAVSQAGFAKGKIEPDPDGAGPEQPRSAENVYDQSGRVVATRFSNDPWTCTNYDDKGRVSSTVVPDVNGRKGRTISNNYAVNGNPLITSTSDDAGTITVETDLLGRVIKYTDIKGSETTSQFDNAGRLIARSGPLGDESFVYDDYDRLVAQKLGVTTYAQISYDTYSRITDVAYPAAGMQKVTYERDTLGRLNKLTYTLGDGTQTISDTVSRSVTGDVLSGTENGVNKSYGYDGAGRLTTATIGGNSYSYNFGATSAATCSQASANLSAGKNGNRVSQTINGQTTTYCYDNADRLISSSDALVGAPVYDDHGNTVKLGTDGQVVTTLAYDAGDRNTGIKEQKTSTTTQQVQVATDEFGNPVYQDQTTTSVKETEVSYTRDVQNRIVGRNYSVAVDGIVNALESSNTSFGFTGASDTPDIVYNASGAITEKYLQLPGNVLVTIRPNETTTAKQYTYSLVNIHSDAFATTNGLGELLGTTLTGPFGEAIAGQTNPNNTVNGATYGYTGQHQKLTEGFSLAMTQMGARVYVAAIGRFLQVDPVEGGTDNAYVYVNDAVNDFDLSGAFGWKKAFAKVALVASIAAVIPGPIGMAAAGVSAAAYAAAGDKKNAAIMAAGIALAAVGAGGAVVAYKAAKAVNGARQFKSTMAIGREAHRVFGNKIVAAGGRSEVYLGKKYGRADAVYKNRVIELKPHNSRAISRGMVQLSRYEKGSKLKGQLWTYKKTWHGSFKYKCYSGC